MGVGNHAFPSIPFLHDFDTGHGIKYISSAQKSFVRAITQTNAIFDKADQHVCTFVLAIYRGQMMFCFI